MKSLLTILFIAIGSIFTQAQNQNNDYPNIMPSFQFIKLKGDGIYDSKNITKNKQTLIGLVSPECIHCLLTLEHLNNNLKRLENINIILVTEYEKDIFIEKMKEIAPNLLNSNLIEVLQDPNYEFVDKFKPVSLPTFYLYNKNNELEIVTKGSVEINQLFQYL
ncbi:MAG: hypothetical protein KBS93_10425 [Flavobacteriaceae bacterium]|nr:hypothetical protein [Candidatus Onthonaster equi]